MTMKRSGIGSTSRPSCSVCPFCGVEAIEFNPAEICPSEETDTRRWRFKHKVGCWFNQYSYGVAEHGETLVYQNRLKEWNRRQTSGSDCRKS